VVPRHVDHGTLFSSAPLADYLFALDSDATSGDQFALYRDLYSGGTDVERLGDGFRAQVAAWRMDRMLLFDRRLAQVAHHRSLARIKKDGFDHFAVQVVIEGSMEVDTGSGFVTLLPGEIMLVDVGRSSRNRIRSAHIVTVAVSRIVLETALGGTGALHGRVIPSEPGCLFADFVASVARRAPMLTSSDLPAVSRAFIELLATAVGSTALARTTDLNRVEFARREAVRRHIEANLGDPELSAETISEATGVSRATIYRIFAADEGVVRVIQQRRLLHLRTRLDDVADSRSLADLADACGFRSESHMSRQFRDIYGQAPGEYRALVHQAVTTELQADLARQRWAAWMTELS
jgi:AraC-like DNA-binding protein